MYLSALWAGTGGEKTLFSFTLITRQNILIVFNGNENTKLVLMVFATPAHAFCRVDAIWLFQIPEFRASDWC